MTIFTCKEDFKASPLPGKALPGVVVVEMSPRKDEIGGILIPDAVQNQTRKDIGCVIQSGHDDYKVGETVYVRWDQGKCVSGLRKGEVRFYGVARNKEGNGVSYDVSKAVICDMDFNPKGRNLIIKRFPADSFLETTRKEYDAIGEVVKVGSGCQEVSVGDKVVVLDGVQRFIGFDEWEDHFLIDEQMVFAIID